MKTLLNLFLVLAVAASINSCGKDNETNTTGAAHSNTYTTGTGNYANATDLNALKAAVQGGQFAVEQYESEKYFKAYLSTIVEETVQNIHSTFTCII